MPCVERPARGGGGPARRPGRRSRAGATAVITGRRERRSVAPPNESAARTIRSRWQRFNGHNLDPRRDTIRRRTVVVRFPQGHATRAELPDCRKLALAILNLVSKTVGQGVSLNRIDHVGVVVDDLVEASALLSERFSLTPEETIERDDLHAAFFACGDTRVEIIEVLDPTRVETVSALESRRASNTSRSRWTTSTAHWRCSTHLASGRQLRRRTVAAGARSGRSQLRRTA
jgi:hypothetical protein